MVSEARARIKIRDPCEDEVMRAWLFVIAVAAAGCSDDGGSGGADAGRGGRGDADAAPLCGGHTCPEDSVCDFQTGFCERIYGCGYPGEPCCFNDTCNGVLYDVCRNGVCLVLPDLGVSDLSAGDLADGSTLTDGTDDAGD